MRIIPIINHLKTNVALLDGRVERATQLMALTDSEIDTGLPICFVHTFSEKAEANATIGAVDQYNPKQFRLMIAAENIDLDAGLEPLEDLREAIFAQLLGWRPDALHDGVEYVGGDVLEVSSRMIWWVDVFSTNGLLSN